MAGEGEKEADLDEIDEDAVPICPCCLTPVDSDEELFCPKCGAPIDPVASMMPFERIHAQGYVFRQAVAKPTNWLVVVGIWVLLAPQVIVIVALLLWPGGASGADASPLLPEPPVAVGWDERGMQFLLGVYALVLAVIVGRVTWAFVQQRRNGDSA